MAAPAFCLDRNEFDDDDKWIAAVLRNWGRFCTWGEPPWPHDPGVCASAEGRYIIPKWEGEETPPPEPDLLLGEKVEGIVSDLHRIHAKAMRALRLKYATLPDSAVRAILDQRGQPFSHEQADWMRAVRCKVSVNGFNDLLAAGSGMIMRAMLEATEGRRRTG